MIFCHPQANCFHRRLPLLITSTPPNLVKSDNINQQYTNGKTDMNNDNLSKNTEIMNNGSHKNISHKDAFEPPIHPQTDDKTSLNPSNESKGFSPKDSNKFRPFLPPHISEPEIQSGKHCIYIYI